MRRLTFGPSLTLKGRKYKGLRGWAGKPFHPPLTDVPPTAYLFTAVFDVLSIALHSDHQVLARQLYIAGTWTLLGGAGINIAYLSLGRDRSGGRAIAVLNLDSTPPDSVLRSLAAIDGVQWAERVSL